MVINEYLISFLYNNKGKKKKEYNNPMLIKITIYKGFNGFVAGCAAGAGCATGCAATGF